MEQVIRRAVILISIVSLTLGALVFAAGWRGYHQANDKLSEIFAVQDKQYDACKQAMERAPQSSCLLQLARDSSADSWTESARYSATWLQAGVLLGLIIPAALWLLFIAGRWIATGRWRNRPRSVRATYIPKDSA